MEKENRKREYRLTLRLNEKELKELELLSMKNNSDKNKIIRELILNAKYEDIQEIKTELLEIGKLARMISTNLNQIAKKINSPKELQVGYDYVERLRELWQLLKE